MSLLSWKSLAPVRRVDEVVGVSPSGKAAGFDPAIRRFESFHPSQLRLAAMAIKISSWFVVLYLRNLHVRNICADTRPRNEPGRRRTALAELLLTVGGLLVSINES